MEVEVRFGFDDSVDVDDGDRGTDVFFSKRAEHQRYIFNNLNNLSTTDLKRINKSTDQL